MKKKISALNTLIGMLLLVGSATVVGLAMQPISTGNLVTDSLIGGVVAFALFFGLTLIHNRVYRGIRAIKEK